MQACQKKLNFKKKVQKRKMSICVTISGESEKWTQMQANGAKGG